MILFYPLMWSETDVRDQDTVMYMVMFNVLPLNLLWVVLKQKLTRKGPFTNSWNLMRWRSCISVTKPPYCYSVFIVLKIKPFFFFQGGIMYTEQGMFIICYYAEFQSSSWFYSPLPTPPPPKDYCRLWHQKHVTVACFHMCKLFCEKKPRYRYH